MATDNELLQRIADLLEPIAYFYRQKLPIGSGVKSVTLDELDAKEKLVEDHK